MGILNLYNCLGTYLVIGALLFGFGIYGLVARKTVIGMLIASELVLAGSSVNFMAFNRFLAPDPAVGQIFHPVHHGHRGCRSCHCRQYRCCRVQKLQKH